MATDSSSVPGTERFPLEAMLAVIPSTTADCPVVREAPNAVDVSQTLSCGLDDCRSCHTELTIAEGGDRRTVHISTDIVPACVCSVLATSGCVFSLESVVDGTLRISVVVHERDTVRELVEAIRETGASVRLERIVPRETTTERSERSAVEMSGITEKQREAVELAVELGYYDEPRRTDLQELADRLEISRSAVSQRLNGAESTVIRSLVTESAETD